MPMWDYDPKFAAVDKYMNTSLLPHDSILEGVLSSNQKAGFEPIDVAPNQGKLLNLLVRMCRARRILELGALGGYSTIWMAKALPQDGSITTCEIDEECAKLTASNAAEAGFQDMIDVRLGPAIETMQKLYDDGVDPFDFIFVDADKDNNPTYLDLALKLSKKGTVIFLDNIVRHGKIVEPSCTEPEILGLRTMFEQLADCKKIDMTAIQTIGCKAWDGFGIGIVTQ